MKSPNGFFPFSTSSNETRRHVPMSASRAEADVADWDHAGTAEMSTPATAAPASSRMFFLRVCTCDEVRESSTPHHEIPETYGIVRRAA